MRNIQLKRIFITGGAGFIGSHFADHFLDLPETEQITIYDNFSSGSMNRIEQHMNNKKFKLVQGDISDSQLLVKAMAGHDSIIHLASNPDIAKAVTEPSIDFDQGTFLTHNVLEAMRLNKAKRILYASGSGVYGDLGEQEIKEDHGPLVPTSTYGASKLAGEALISAYCHMFDLSGLAFRFANVVGNKQSHGVGFDFIAKLKKNPRELIILGDGNQSKSYIYVKDVINAVTLAARCISKPFDAFNIATDDYISVNEIAKIAAKAVVGDPSVVAFVYTGGRGGWKGDIPVVRLNSNKIKQLGWRCQHTSKEAIFLSINEMLGKK